MRRCSARRGKRAEKPEAYPLRYTGDFFAMFDEVAAGISSSAVGDIFEIGSRSRMRYGTAWLATFTIGVMTCLVTTGEVQAQTDLYVRGAGRLIPVASPRLCLESGEKGPDADIPAIIAKDLDLSGYFDVQDPKSYIEAAGKCGPQESTTYSDWSVLGTEGLIKGQISVDNRARLSSQMYLHDVQKQGVVLAKQYDGDLSQVRLIAHKFANEVMKHYTGFPGVFGSEIAFSSRVGRFKELFVMEMDGSNLRQLTNERGLAISASWNPSGTKLVYTSFRNRVPDLFVIDIENRTTRQLTHTLELEVSARFLNENQIVFSRTEGIDSDILVMDLDGKGVRKLTPPNRAIDVSPFPSPDGSQILFCSNRGGGPQIYVMGSDGSNARRVSFGASNYCTSPAWSPTGDKIAYVCRADGGFNLFVSDPDGSNAVQLTSSGNNEDPEFSADGRYITFATTQFGGGFSIAILRTDGMSMKRITSSRGGDFEPAWGPLPK
jgi:TolB protein